MNKEDIIIELLVAILRGIMLIFYKKKDKDIIDDYNKYAETTIKLTEDRKTKERV